MADRATLALATALLALLSVTLPHLQAQAGATEGGSGVHAGAAAFVLLEPRPERRLTAAAVNGTGSKPVCGRCSCCLANTNPQVCLTTCCFRRSCAGSGCPLQAVSCGCNGCDYRAGTK